jgi:uncharacterized protein (TIGR04222 family)
MTGGPFLALYGILLVVTLITGALIPRWLRPEGRGGVPDTDGLAWLAGGRTRFADTVVARLLSARAIEMEGKDGFRTVRRDAGRNAAEISVLALPQPVRWSQIDRTLKSYAEPVERRLVASGLAIDAGETLQLRLFQTLPYALLFLFGAGKWMVGTARDKPVGILTVLLIATAVLALIRFAMLDRRTNAGKAALQEAATRSARLKRAPTNDETDMAVALFGTAVLAGSALAAFHRLRTPSDSSSDGGSSSSDGGGGCGGGGCGGCGG